jgi:hypothetical protein
MNEKNFQYLRDQIKYSGFGEALEDALKQNLMRQSPEFTLQHQATFGRDQTSTSLHFNRSATSDMYFLNSYMVSLKKDQDDQKINQTFYVGKENNITLKEGYNLMSGRAVNKDLVNKEGKIYNAWLQLDFKQTDNNGNFKTKQYHQNYGFDLEKELAKHPIKELSTQQDKSRLIESLHKGNRQMVSFLDAGGERKGFIEANPQFKNLTVYDQNMHVVGRRQQQSEKQSVEQQTSSKKNSKENKIDGPGEPKHSRSKKAKKSKDLSLSH